MAAPNATKRLSPAGEKFIAGWEGCVLHPYNDPWNATIGIGHLIHAGRVTQADLKRYRGFTRNDAYALLKGDVATAEDAIRHHIHVELNQNQYDTLVDLVYNCGPAPLDGTVGRLINARDMQGAANAMLAWDHANGTIVQGLAHRRHADHDLFLQPIVPPPPYVPADEHRWITEHDQLIHQRSTPWSRMRERVLHRYMSKRILLLVHLADDDGGWNKLNREARYRALLARTK
jgi:lysozyme